MRIVHLSDLHLGHRAFLRTERGVNLRERDVNTSFQLAVHEISRIRPQLILISGDLFDLPDPPSAAFLALTRGIRQLQEHLPGVPILAIAGERDTPNSPADPGPVAVLDAIPGVEGAAGAPRSVHLTGLDTHVLLVPYRAVVRPPFPELRPDPSARWNILLVRGRPWPSSEAGRGPQLDAGGALELCTEGWDYIALGGGHEARLHAPRIRTAGSLERLGPDPWHGAGTEKGFQVVNLETGEGEFHPLPTRPVVDLAPVRVDPDDLEAGTRRLRDLLEGTPGGIDGKILRVRLRGPIRTAAEGIRPGLLAAIRQRSAHAEFVVEPASGGGGQGSSRGGRRRPKGVSSDVVPLLKWMLGNGRSGQTALLPGLWAISAEHPEDRERIREALESEGPVGWEARGIRLEIEGALDAQFSPLRSLLGGSGLRPEAGPGMPNPNLVSTGSSEDLGVDARRLRGDWIEASGDAEARTLEWARERQEADSRLQLYRDRARELRGRINELKAKGPDTPCPTCQRPLAESHNPLLQLLSEEWEEVVQDGQWWKRRRAQLEAKPTDLTTLERHALELQAALEGALGGIAASANRGSSGSTTPPPVVANALSWGPPELVSARVRGAGLFLQRLTEGRVEGMALGEDGAVNLVEPGGGFREADATERALIPLLLTLAGEREFPSGEPATGIRLLTGLHAVVPSPILIRLVEILSEFDDSVPDETRPIWIVLLPPEVVAQRAERVRGHLEVLRDEMGRPRVRVASAGDARVRLVEAAPPGPLSRRGKSVKVP